MNLNVVPVLKAAQGIYQTLHGPAKSWVSAEQLIPALESYLSALHQQDLPQIPQEHLNAFQEKIQILRDIIHDDRISRYYAIAIVSDLLRQRLLAPEGADEIKTVRMIQDRIQTLTIPGNEGLVRGLEELHSQRTIRGTEHLLRGGLAAIDLSQETPLRSDRPPTQPPLTDEEDYFQIQMPTHRSGQKEFVPVSSSYKLIDRDSLSGTHIPFAWGGCSMVYRGIETEMKRRVCIKVMSILNPGDQQEFLEGFRNGLELQPFLARSRRFVQVYYTGVTPHGHPFLVMELMEGGSLSDHIKKSYSDNHSMPIENAMDLANQMIACVAEIHSKDILKEEGKLYDGIVHRDIKPANFLMTDEGSLKLADFDFALKFRKDSATVPHDVVGTPGYFPLGEPDNFQRDVFALGVSLFILFTGEHPFHPKNVDSIEGKQNKIGRILNNILKKDYRILRENLEKRNVLLPLIDVILKAFARKPEDRYANAVDLLFDFLSHKARLLEEEAIAILKDTSNEPDEEVRRERWREKIEDALREYGRINKDHPNPRFLAKLVELNLECFRYTYDAGKDKDARYYAERIRQYAPGGAADLEVNEPIQVKMKFDFRGIPENASARIHLLRFDNRGDVLKLNKVEATYRISKTSREPLELSRGIPFSLLFTMDGAAPVCIPLRVRSGPCTIRIPIYPQSRIPEEGVIMPAGPVAVSAVGESHSARILEGRTTRQDVVILPLPSEGDWAEFFRLSYSETDDPELKQQILNELFPKHWRLEARKTLFDQNGNRIDLSAPVTHVSYPQFLKYLKRMKPNARPATLNEWKRASKTNRTPRWPWGDKPPHKFTELVAGFRHQKHPNPVAPLSNTRNTSILDYTQFSIPGVALQPVRKIMGIALNTQKFVSWPDSEEDRSRILRAVGLGNLNPNDPSIPEKHSFVVGSPYNRAAPSTIDMMEVYPIDHYGPISILPVIPLDEAEPTPSLDEFLR